MRRVVVTGLGAVCPSGNNVDDAWETVLAARPAAGPISRFDATSLPVTFAAEVREFDPTSVMPAKEARQSSRFVQFAVAAAQEAADHSGFDSHGEEDRFGCCIGVGVGGAFGDAVEKGSAQLRNKGSKAVSPLLIPYAIPNMAAGLVSIKHGLQGVNFCTATACASGNHAIGEGYLHVGSGTADVMVVGGAEASISPLSVASFARMRALSQNNDHPSEASRPFDHDRDGFVMGEGGAVLVLEEYQHARKRGAEIHAEIVGFGMSADAHHITSPAPEGGGAARCMASALKSAQVAPEQIDYINAHGTSTRINDASESTAIETVFGEHVAQLSISSSKGVTGHCLGAAGAIEGVFTVLAVSNAVVPPTANYTTPDPTCRLDYTPNQPRERSIELAISNSFGFGGQNACIVFKRFDD
jgi:3-oxoacyl-[acyl-carrier-protein] synthase II